MADRPADILIRWPRRIGRGSSSPAVALAACRKALPDPRYLRWLAGYLRVVVDLGSGPADDLERLADRVDEALRALALWDGWCHWDEQHPWALSGSGSKEKKE